MITLKYFFFLSCVIILIIKQSYNTSLITNIFKYSNNICYHIKKKISYFLQTLKDFKLRKLQCTIAWEGVCVELARESYQWFISRSASMPHFNLTLWLGLSFLHVFFSFFLFFLFLLSRLPNRKHTPTDRSMGCMW